MSLIKDHAVSTHGFTLIELSIVLVIIGLIAGGVLVGQDMIKAAEIRSQVAQIEGYNQAFNAFRTKYAALPGDISTSASHGLMSNNASAANRGRGDGNGLIQSSATMAVNIGGYQGEPAVAFTHLSETGLIKDGITVANYQSVGGFSITNTSMPAAKIGRGNRLFVTANAGVHYFFIARFTGNINAAGNYAMATAPSSQLTPIHAFQIDSKMDDGVPDAGLVRSFQMAAAPTSLSAAGEVAATLVGGAAIAGTPAAGECFDTVTPAIYATATATTRDVVGCQLRIRAQF